MIKTTGSERGLLLYLIEKEMDKTPPDTKKYKQLLSLYEKVDMYGDS